MKMKILTIIQLELVQNLAGSNIPDTSNIARNMMLVDLLPAYSFSLSLIVLVPVSYRILSKLLCLDCLWHNLKQLPNPI